MCCFLSASPHPHQYTLTEQGWDNHDEYPLQNWKEWRHCTDTRLEQLWNLV